MTQRIIAIIPARGGSKGIPRKNIRLLGGKPLIAYTIESALKSRYIENVFVSTDDEEIAEISRIFGAEIIKRPDELGQDHVTLDPVIYNALNTIERDYKINPGLVLTIQPTSPLLSTESIDRAIEVMLEGKNDTLISVKPDNHLFWTKKDGDFFPMYKERKNRQYLDPIYKETGSILISRREIISENNRIGKKIFLFEIPSGEALDIDTYQDWWVAENLFRKTNVAVRVDGDHDMGLGHVYRMITLANQMVFNHNLYFFMDKNKKLGIEKVKEYNFPIIEIECEEEFFKRLKEHNIHIVINDILDTSKEFIQRQKKNGYFIVNFEDLGEGTEYANIVVNALYENSYPPENHYFGYKYVCLRDEFYIFPRIEVKEKVKEILITFGGTDPNNMTMKALKAIEMLDLKDISVNIVLGLGYARKDELRKYSENLIKKGFNIAIKENIRTMAREMYNADIVITSNGRTIYEVSCIGTPCISISQNERESRHLFVHNTKSIKYLGMAYEVSEEAVALALNELIHDFEARKNMNKKIQDYDLRKGIDRVIRTIFDKFYEFRENGTDNNK